MECISPTNLKLLWSLDIEALWEEASDPSYLDGWLRFLHALSTEATGLRRLAVYWATRFKSVVSSPKPSYGALGSNLDFVRALARI